MEQTYCTVSEVNTYASNNGELSWLSLSGETFTGAVNLLAGYAAGVNTILVDGFTDAANPISSGDTFTIASDSTATVYTVKGSVINVNTTTLFFSPVLAEAVADDDVITLTRTTSGMAKTRLAVLASKEISRYIGVINQDGTLFYPDNTDLNKAAIIQSIFLSKVQGMRDSSQRIGQYSASTYSDGVISISGVGKPTLDNDAKFLVDKFMDEYSEVIYDMKTIYSGAKGVGR